MARLVKSEYKVYSDNISHSLRVAVVADLHSRKGIDPAPVIDALREISPDLILMPGDIFERLDGSDTEGMSAGLELMRKCASMAPTFYSIGNHENGGTRSWNKLKWLRIKSIPKYYDPTEIKLIEECGVTLLDDSYVMVNGVAIGGLSSGLINEKRRPDLDFLEKFSELDIPKILLCHHPEYFDRYISGKNIDLTVSGHAHGGQWRVLGRGVFAPGQGLFPKYTSGVYRGSLAVSKGLKPSGLIPRIFNPREVMAIDVMRKI